VTSRRSEKPDLSFAGDCTSCGCTEVSCSTKVWLSGRKCCENCDHNPGGRSSNVKPRGFRPRPPKIFLPER
jgi:hypothetical protein